MILVSQRQLDALADQVARLAEKLQQSLGLAQPKAPPPPPPAVQQCKATQAPPAKSLEQKPPSANAMLNSYAPTGMKNGGVAASRAVAQAELADAKAAKATFEKVGAEYKIPPALLAGIASRESDFGKSPYMNSDGWGDKGNAYGFMQVDKRRHQVVGKSIDDIDHIRQAAGIFNDKLAAVERHHPDWPEARKYQRATALYNGNKRPEVDRDLSINDGNIDLGTTGEDYSNDVWARSQYFDENW